jgi:actin-like ATPase involved in cell morphogenesis
MCACVPSAPAEFDARRRNATADAARAVGMQVAAMISEPTAAALAYGLHKRDNVQTVVVVDFGAYFCMRSTRDASYSATKNVGMRTRPRTAAMTVSGPK